MWHHKEAPGVADALIKAEKTSENRWFETTGQASFGRAKAAYWKINGLGI